MSESIQPWQHSIKHAIRSWETLRDLLELPIEEAREPSSASSKFPLFVTREFVARMEKGNLHDPLLLQVLPHREESEALDFELLDPVGDLHAEIVPGLLQKYKSRALLITTSACAVHCRYCFRQNFPYEAAPKSLDDWEPAFDYLEKDASIDEVILSGGDPLMLVDAKLGSLMQRIESIPHIERLRIHTRLPVMVPSRVTNEFCSALQRSRLTPWIVLHINHANEIDDQVSRSIEMLRGSGAVLLNQAVLLKQVNDRADVLESLCRKLVNLGVMPYYLHQMDPVQGSARFTVPISEGLALIKDLQSRLPGYAIPKYVAEIAGQPSKTELQGSLLELHNSLA